MKIKAKLFLGIGVLFTMIVLLMGLSIFFINSLSSDTKNILVANYNTLDYSRKMQIALDDGVTNAFNEKLFSDNLLQQQKNITEPGEKELTGNLALHFSQLKKNLSDSSLLRLVRKDIADIMLLNMLAIGRKSKIAEDTASKSIFWVSIFGTLCFIIAFTLLVNLPGNVANPIRELTGSIQQIAERNYSQRVHFEKQNEFGKLASAFNTMAEKLEEYQASSLEKLMIEKKRIETLINNMHDPVIGLDDNKKVLFMNDTALKIAGLKAEDVIGKTVQDIAMKNDLIRLLVQDLFAETVNSSIKQAPLKIYADNKESYFEKDIIPIKIIPTGEKDEKLIGNVILLQNITPYKELDFAKTNFIATVSHELKTPIASIQMSSQLLQNKQVGTMNEEQQSLVESIKDDATRLLKITGELLNMTQVETGTIQMNVMPTSIVEIIDYAISANKLAAEQKAVNIETSVEAGLSQVLADKEKTAWVLNNLVSNAIRYSYENAAINIDVTKETGKIKFSVKDSGQGISPQYVDKVFDRYFRIPGTRKEGTGLGLSISKEFIEAQGGAIQVESEYGTGSNFSFTLSGA